MKIKQIRRMNNLSQAAFAKIFGIAQNTLSQYETGSRKVPPQLLRDIADRFNTTIDYLLDADQICDDRIGAALIEEREWQKISRRTVSEDTRIPYNDLTAYEKNDEPINLYILKILCIYFGKSVYEFYNDHGMYDEYIPQIFDGDVDKYERFKDARDEDAQKQVLDTKIINLNKEKEEFVTLYRKYKELPKDKQKIVDDVIDGFLPKKPKEALPDDDDID
ncbi:helix-turn-helix transcriptional regulator [uncultured Megasphaera sp.]|uniref:helix-turn-helix transcriptional regulator n=1 Tax=uncultured Megasphaera sp. TaxID=165188 RepID=UPI0025F279A1|nr:helix-turn-helix transcriptional regulator [uncultured Megasphaera sp.]